ncbi:MAG: DDE-type integrase/transposase/recombinase, partial [Nanoarchaeota archaeon]
MNNTNQKQEKYKLVSVIKPKVCPICKSEEIIRWGFRFNHTTKKQRWKCKSCSECFVVDDGFFKTKHKREVITQCLNLYMNGMSLRKVIEHFNQFSDYQVSHQSILNWIRKYAIILNPFMNSLDLDLSRTYHTDEIFLKCNKEQHYFWNTLDKGTRMLIATHYSTKRDSKSARMLFMKIKHKPLTLFTDGLQGYRKAYRKVWGANKRSQDKKIYIRLKADRDKRNNISERIQGTIRERVKVMRGFKDKESAKLILDLFVVYYNCIRVHQGINKTPI